MSHDNHNTLSSVLSGPCARSLVENRRCLCFQRKTCLRLELNAINLAGSNAVLSMKTFAKLRFVKEMNGQKFPAIRLYII